MPSIGVLQRLRSDVFSVYRRESAAIEDYVRTYGERTVVARSADEQPLDVGTVPDPTDHATCSSFVVSHLTGSSRADPATGRRMSTITPNVQDFAGQRTLDVLKTVVADFVAQYGNLARSDNVSDAKDVGPLPNSYSTPIHLCGLAAALDELDNQNEPIPDLANTANVVAQEIADWLDRGNGHIHDSSHLRTEPSAQEFAINTYLTYWCIQSLIDWAALVEGKPAIFEQDEDLISLLKRVKEALHDALESALDRLSRAVAAYHAGVGSLFDAVDLLCMLSSAAGASRFLGRRDQYSTALVRHALDVVFEGYVHNDGSFAPKSAVLTTKGGYSLTVSTAELAAILMNGAATDLRGPHIANLERTFENVLSRRSGPRGWGVGAGDSSMRRSAFGAAGSLAFLRAYHAALDDQIAWQCAKELGVQPYAFDPRLDKIEMPASIRDRITDRVIRPIRDHDRRDLAVMSFVLGGPPGAAKTTIAAKIAQELKWPMLLLDQGSFLHRGAGQVESEAERIFDLLLELSDTVVLFDEIEEMVEDRDVGEKSGRYLTTSMLPRIHHLRDLGRVVFMVATNYPERIDSAASRPGRIDAIFTVKAPDRAERQDLLEKLFDSYSASENLRQVFHDGAVASLTEGFTFGYLRELVKSCVSQEYAHGNLDVEVVSDEVRAMAVRVAREAREKETRSDR